MNSITSRQVSSYDFYYNYDEGYNKESWRYITSIKELRMMSNPYHILEPYGILDSELWDADGRHWSRMRDYLEDLKDRHYCILGNLSNGGDPNIDIICSHYQVYFKVDITIFDPIDGFNEFVVWMSILVDDEMRM